MINKLYENLKKLRLDNGLYIASTGEFYRQFCWLRDCFYESLPSLTIEPRLYEQTYHTILDYLKMVENKYKKFSSMIENPHPKEAWRYLHARISATTFDEIHTYWRNKQNDIVGELLFGISLGEQNGLDIIRDYDDIHIINLMIKYLEALEYWNDIDSSLWEEDEEHRASSIGTCVAGLIAIKNLNNPNIIISDSLIKNGKIALNQLLPYETKYRDVDMALLTLIYPFNVVTEEQRNQILYNVEHKLLREHGCLRYIGDQYYNADYSNVFGNEATWSLGDLYLANIYIDMGNIEKGKFHLNRVLSKCPDGNIPELYVNGVPNCNSILGWSNALAILALQKLDKLQTNNITT